MIESETLRSPLELSKLAERLAKVSKIGLDFETASFNGRPESALEHDKLEVVGVGMAFPDGYSCYVPMMHSVGKNANPDQIRGILQKIGSNKELEVWAHNIKFEQTVFRTLRIEPEFKSRDTMIAQWLLGKKLPGAKGLKLKAAVKEFLNYTMTTWEEVMSGNSKAFYVPIDTMTKYCGDDALQCLRLSRKFLPELEDYQLGKVFTDLEIPFVPVLVHMKEVGFALDKDYLDDLHSGFVGERDEIRRQFEEKYRISISSSQAVSKKMYDELKLWSCQGFKRGTSGFYSVDAGHLERVESRLEVGSEGHRALLWKSRFQKLEKLAGTYTKPLVEQAENYNDKRLRGDFHQTGTDTGRLSCVSGDTVLITIPRGSFRIDQYEVHKGDETQTHRGRTRPILRKIVKGLDTMFRVVLESGRRIGCTKEHRFLTPDGWRSLGSMSVGDEVFNVSFEEILERPFDFESCRRVVPARSEQTYDSADSGEGGHYLSHSYGYSSKGCSPREDGFREATEILPQQDGRAESYEGETWRKSPRLEGRLLRLQGLPDDSRRGNEIFCSSNRCSGSSKNGCGESSEVSCCSSHRRESFEQRVGQPSVMHECGTSQASSKTSRIASIAPLGTMEVYDIEVEEDHSYIAHGFINHNSANPNLQNIPTRSEEGNSIRNAFVAEEGWTLGVSDYSQADLVMMAHLSMDTMLTKAYTEKLDLHQLTANNCKCDRSTGKVINLGLIYEMGVNTLAGNLKIDSTEAFRLWTAWHRAYPMVRQYHKRMHAFAEKHGYVRTITGRIRLIPDIHSDDSYKRTLSQHMASNTPDQGSVADFIKIAMRNLFNEWKSRGVLYDYYTKEGKAKILSQVHDELICELRDDFAEEAADDIQRHMEKAVELRVPMTAIPGIGKNWNLAKKDGKRRESEAAKK